MTYARCSHRGCGARGPMHRSLDRAVALFRREHAAMLPSAEVVEQMGRAASRFASEGEDVSEWLAWLDRIGGGS